MLFSKLVQDRIDAQGEHKVVLLLLDSLLARFLRAPAPLNFVDVEKQLLRPIDQLEEGSQDSLFPNGFTAGRFVAVVESSELWRGIC